MEHKSGNTGRTSGQSDKKREGAAASCDAGMHLLLLS